MNAYRDPKRYSWLLSVLVPVSLVIGPINYLWLGGAWRLWVPIGITYLLIPVLAMLCGEDRHNPPDAAGAARGADRYHGDMTHELVPPMWMWLIFRARSLTHRSRR